MKCSKCSNQVEQERIERRKALGKETKCCEACGKKITKAFYAAQNRKAREEAYKSCGLVKVKGALGGTYWE